VAGRLPQISRFVVSFPLVPTTAQNFSNYIVPTGDRHHRLYAPATQLLRF